MTENLTINTEALEPPFGPREAVPTRIRLRLVQKGCS
jgi:hypothetical protein